MTRPVFVSGGGLSHAVFVGLLENVRIRVAIEKERRSLIIHDGGNDSAAMDYVLDSAGITLDDVAVVVQNENGMFAHGNQRYDGATRRLRPHDRVVSISHHLAHAYGAMGTCHLDDGMVFVLDGSGNAYEEWLDLDGAEILTRPPAGHPVLVLREGQRVSVPRRCPHSAGEGLLPAGSAQFAVGADDNTTPDRRRVPDGLQVNGIAARVTGRRTTHTARRPPSAAAQKLVERGRGRVGGRRRSI